MTNPTSAQWEQALLNKITNNGERIAVIERDVSDVKEDIKDIKERLTNIETTMEKTQGTIEKIESLLGWLKWIGGALVARALSLIANFVYSFFS